jgi:hypothetical protein
MYFTFPYHKSHPFIIVVVVLNTLAFVPASIVSYIGRVYPYFYTVHYALLQNDRLSGFVQEFWALKSIAQAFCSDKEGH